MNYKLQKQLKDAGFPFKEWTTELAEQISTEPTLSELIEACNESGILSLNRGWELWNATFSKDGDKTDILVYGKTPEEAVAKLWIKLVKIIKFGKRWIGLERLR